MADPRQSVDNSVTMVVTVWPEVARSGVVPACAVEDEEEEDILRFIKRAINSCSNPFSAIGAGSRPLRIKRSASIMKHLSVGSET